MKVLGLDIGGANIKASNADGNTQSIVFPMWTKKAVLQQTLPSLVADEAAYPDMIALTMTAELADCFQTKSEGVEFVIQAVEGAFPGVPIRVWLTSGEFAEADDAQELPMLVAAANWHALATWAGRAVPSGPAVLLDIGSTTTDVIPLLDGMPIPAGRNDRERLQSGELIYSGAYRTPVCAIVSSVPFRGTQCPVAAEVFATIADALVIAGLLKEDGQRTDTANEQPLTKPNCQQRLARMLCCDAAEFTEQELVDIADFVVGEQQKQIASSFSGILNRLGDEMDDTGHRTLNVEHPAIILSGSGSMLARPMLKNFDNWPLGDVLEMSEMFHQPVAEAACAFAVARLAHDRCRDDLLETHESDVFG